LQSELKNSSLCNCYNSQILRHFFSKSIQSTWFFLQLCKLVHHLDSTLIEDRAKNLQ